MNIRSIGLTAAFAMGFLPSLAGSEEGWKETGHRNGIRTYLGQKNQNGIRPTKASMVVPASPEQVLSVVYGIDDYTHWVPNCVKAQQLESLDSSRLFHQVFEAPFIKDRDLVTNITNTETNNHYKVILRSVPDQLEVDKSRVRIQHFVAEYTITDLGNGQTLVEMSSEIDMEGIPAFLLNWANETQPYETFSQLRQHILNS